MQPNILKPTLLASVAVLTVAAMAPAADAKPGNGNGKGPPENSVPGRGALPPQASDEARENSVPGRGALPPSASDNAGENSVWPSSGDEDEDDDDSDDDDDTEDDTGDDADDDEMDGGGDAAAGGLTLSGIQFDTTDGTDYTLSLFNGGSGDTGGIFVLDAYTAGTGDWLGGYTSDTVSPGTGLTLDIEQTLADAGIMADDGSELILSLSGEFGGTAQARRFTDAIGYAGTYNLCGPALTPISSVLPAAPSSVNTGLTASYRLVNDSDAEGAASIRLLDQDTGDVLAEWTSPAVPASAARTASPQQIEDEGTIVADPATLPAFYTLEASLPAGWRLEPQIADAAAGVAFDASTVCTFAATDAADDGSGDDGTMDDGTMDDGTTDDGATDGESTDDASADDGSDDDEATGEESED